MEIYLVGAWLVATSTAELVAIARLRAMLARFHRRELLSTPSMVRELPSVSVCIPARNERHAMTRCLESVLGSNYSKLEVIVLDDESVDNTSSLIKSFAKDGVRFVDGSTPPVGWLGKNYALSVLLGEASGTYVLFLDVDTVLAPHAIAQLVAYAESTQSTMVSVLPQRSDVWRMSVVVAPLRYFWHVLFHRPSRPVAASSAWMVRRKALVQDFAELASLRSDVEPEVTIARKYLAEGAYRFLTSHQLLGVSYEKRMSSQIETTIRLRYPQLGFSVWRSVLSCLLKLGVGSAPCAAAIVPSLWPLALASYLLGAYCYLLYLLFVWERGAWLGMWLWPFVLLGDAWLTLVSMIRYQTNSVTWKGRPITSQVAREEV
ncbi:glycosyltransferase [Candidatus Mycosynbacter amalyticus]|uniref:Glycosyltransferase n=1 Tax=Candidatus Mycosynbacter amalyticus TaxID=2665156 RepID=A0A857MJN2_9BACT|nr:glycosyltransferase family 2 protein [Candidatus Mycosynbacter amalyticus]QHN42784.1 glycosyltransferase [Candidatus Mycosynbacter amalyticus]